MRIQNLAIVASWLLWGAQADDDIDGGFKAIFQVANPEAVPGEIPSEASYKITHADTARTALYLLQIKWTSDAQSPSPRQEMKTGKILDLCIDGSSDEDDKSPCQVGISVTVGFIQTISYEFATARSTEVLDIPGVSYSYLLCFANSTGWCETPSQTLIAPGLNSPTDLVLDAPRPLAELVAFTPKPARIIDTPERPSTTNPDEAAKTIIGATVTAAPTPAATSPPAVVEASKSSKGGLSTGAKVGIAVGAVVLVLAILILALILLRKKHRQRSNKQRLMTNQSFNADSRDLISEKEITPTSYQIPNLNFHAPGQPTNETRHLSALQPYDSVSQPYNGSAASIPRRRDTINNNPPPTVIAPPLPPEPIPQSQPSPPISREVSAASSLPPTRSLAPHEPTSPSSVYASPTSNYEEYHDVPSYPRGHGSPQVFQGGLQAPFLSASETDSERGGSLVLTDADQARLAEEEEERRIDAAIAESERLKNSHGR